MITRTREQLIIAIDRQSQPTASTTIFAGASNEPLNQARSENFCIFPANDPYNTVDLVDQQYDAFIRDVISGGVNYSLNDLNFKDATENQLRENKKDFEETIALALQERFKEMWSIVLLSHSQRPAYTLPTIIKYAIHNNGKPTTISIDLPSDDEQLTKIEPEIIAGSQQNSIICHFITRLERMPITDNSIIDKATGKKKIIGYLDGPMQTVHSLKEMQEVIDGVKTTVWRYQLETIESKNPLVISIFEGKMFSQMELPAYAAWVNAKHTALNDACDVYLAAMLRRLGLQITEFKYSSENKYSLITHPEMQTFLDGFPDLTLAAQWCTEKKATDVLPGIYAAALKNFATQHEISYSNSKKNMPAAVLYMDLIRKCAANPIRLSEIVQHVALVSQLKAELNNTNQSMPDQIDHFERVLMDKQANLREKPNEATKVFVQKIDETLEKQNTAGLVKVINKLIGNEPNLFASAIRNTSPSILEPIKPTGKKTLR